MSKHLLNSVSKSLASRPLQLGAPLSSTSICAQGSNVDGRRQLSYISQVRRQKRRSQWAARNDPNNDPDADQWLLTERFGCDPEVNYTLSNYKITPHNEAFRNLHLGGLVMLANGKTDKDKALHVDLKEGDEFTIYYGEKGPAFDKETKTINLQQYKLLMTEVKDYISKGENIFVHDGALGSHPSCEARVRAVCDNAVSALYLHHVIPRVSVKNVDDFQHSITAYIVPGYVPSNLKDVGLTSRNFAIVDIPRGICVVGGTLSTEALRTALSAVSQPRFLIDNNAVPLQADVVEIEGQTKPILILNPDNSLRSQADLNLKKLASHNVTWSEKGIFRLFDGASAPLGGKEQKRKLGDLVENSKGKPVRFTTRNAAQSNVHPAPSALVVVVADQSKVLPPLAKINPDNLSHFLLAGYSGGKFKPMFSDVLTSDAQTASDKLIALIKANNTSVYVINTAAKDKALASSEISDLVKAIGTGKAASGTVSPSSAFAKLSPITSVSGLNLILDPSKRGWGDANAYKAEAAKYEGAVSKFVTDRFPAPATTTTEAPSKSA